MNSQHPLISILIPAYNGNAFLPEAIESALTQSYGNLEIIVSDDCSQENTAAAVDRFNDRRIRLIRNEFNLGLTVNLNRSIQASHGEYICWLNQDDVFYDRKVERQLRVLEQNRHIGACFTEKDDIDAGGRPLPRFNPSREKIPVENQLLQLFGGCYLTATSVMVPRRVISKVGLFNDCFQIAFDYDMWFRIRQHYEFHTIDQPLIAFRHHAANLSAAANSSVVGLEAAAIVSNALRKLELDQIFPHLRQIADSRRLRSESASCLLVLARLIWSQESWSHLLVAQILSLLADAILLNQDLLGAYALAEELAQSMDNTNAAQAYAKKWRVKRAAYQKGVEALKKRVIADDAPGISETVDFLTGISPLSGDPYFQLACIQAGCGQLHSAGQNCRRALATNPEHEGAQQLLARL